MSEAAGVLALIAPLIEKIAQGWDGCIYTDAPGGDIDIGEAIRAEGKKLVNPAQVQIPIALADYTQDQVDELSRHEIANRLRGYSHPLLKAAADSIDYLAAQEGLLEKAQQEAERVHAELKEMKRPLDQQMARLNERVVELTAKLDALQRQLKPDVRQEARDVLNLTITELSGWTEPLYQRARKVCAALVADAGPAQNGGER
jgi:hypothetical protein